jgi:hypothetical protein
MIANIPLAISLMANITHIALKYWPLKVLYES